MNTFNNAVRWMHNSHYQLNLHNAMLRLRWTARWWAKRDRANVIESPKNKPQYCRKKEDICSSDLE